MLKQIFIAGLALFLFMFLFLLIWRILALLRLLPCVLFLAASRLVFPEWCAASPFLSWGITAVLGLIGLLSWIIPLLQEWQYNRVLEQNIADQIECAKSYGIAVEDLTIELVNGIPKVVCHL